LTRISPAVNVLFLVFDISTGVTIMRVRVALVSIGLGLGFATGAMAATITGSPDPAPVCDGTGQAVITVSWNAADTNATRVEVRVGSATGSLFAAGAPVGAAPTGKWVNNGTPFFLVNPANKQVLAQYAARLVTTGCKAPAAPPPEEKGFWRRLFGK
jgi:hypothetical protein